MPKKETKVVGLQDLADRLKKFKYANAQGFEEGIQKSAYFLLRKALELVPIDTGYLASTGHVHVTGSGFKTRASVRFSAEYSIWVHERLDLAHGRAFNIKHFLEIQMGKTHFRRPQEQAKFLETPLRLHKKQLLDYVRMSMREKGRTIR